MKTNEKRLAFIRTLSAAPSQPTIDYDGEIMFGIYTTNDGRVIGGDGFGYEWDGKKLVKFPHHGGVKIGKDVGIGYNVCIDRATLDGEFTTIGDGTKIDNLVHIAHNVKIGKHCLIGAGVIIGGSVVIGDRVCIWGGTFIERKIKIGNDAEIRGGSAVFSDVGEGEVWAGNPAKLIFTKHE